MKGGTLLQFQDLKDPFVLTNQDYYKFLQISRHRRNNEKGEFAKKTNLGGKYILDSAALALEKHFTCRAQGGETACA